ncbi:MAG: sulfite exporter TauE/SafE family protein [Cohaesibacter sp.]|nr:sulfite exporter TauE/SafE family protein [Cohaesibacter sp.]
MPLPADFYYFAIPAIILAGLSKGGFAASLSMLGDPILSLSIPPLQAAAILLPILIVMDMVGIIAYRGKADWSILKKMVPAASFGIALGWLLADQLNKQVIRFCVGLTTYFCAGLCHQKAVNKTQQSVIPNAP